MHFYDNMYIGLGYYILIIIGIFILLLAFIYHDNDVFLWFTIIIGIIILLVGIHGSVYPR